MENKLNDINKIVDSILNDIFIISLKDSEESIDKLTYLYGKILNVRNDIFTIMITKKDIDTYNDIKFKICEATITVKIMIKEKSGLNINNEKLLLQNLY